MCTVLWWIAFITIPAACFIFGWNTRSGSWEITVNFHRHFCFLSKLSPWRLFPSFQLPCSAIHTMTILQPSFCISSQTHSFLNGIHYFSWWFLTKTGNRSKWYILLINMIWNVAPSCSALEISMFALIVLLPVQHYNLILGLFNIIVIIKIIIVIIIIILDIKMQRIDLCICFHYIQY